MASIEFRHVSKRWGSVAGVTDLSLAIADREFLVLLGPSGCGKTTTMRMIAGLDHPSEGEIAIGERIVNDLTPRERDIAMVFQNYGLYPHMSVRQNIGYPLKVRAVPKAEADARIERAAAQVELGPYLDRRPSALSGGQRQRVALARSLVRRPQVFLMDEPLSNLDAKLRVTMRAELKHLHHELGVTTVYVTHDQMEAMTLADRVAVMDKGKIQQLATPDAIYDDPSNLFVAGFIGSPGMNFIHGALRGGSFSGGGFDLAGFAGAPDAPAVVLGVRPEDLAVVEPEAGTFSAPVYAAELTGDAVLVTVLLQDRQVCARASRDVRKEIGAPVGFRLDPRRAFLFDAGTQDRIRFQLRN